MQPTTEKITHYIDILKILYVLELAVEAEMWKKNTKINKIGRCERQCLCVAKFSYAWLSCLTVYCAASPISAVCI